jgi:hypothetical protein
MKEQIENLISKWSDDAEFYMTQQQKSELAERLDKAIGIDEEKINSELLSRSEWFYKFQEGNASGGWLRHNIAKAIAQSRPLKCDIEDVAQGRQDRLTRRKA